MADRTARVCTPIGHSPLPSLPDTPATTNLQFLPFNLIPPTHSISPFPLRRLVSYRSSASFSTVVLYIHSFTSVRSLVTLTVAVFFLLNVLLYLNSYHHPVCLALDPTPILLWRIAPGARAQRGSSLVKICQKSFHGRTNRNDDRQKELHM